MRITLHFLTRVFILYSPFLTWVVFLPNTCYPTKKHVFFIQSAPTGHSMFHRLLFKPAFTVGYMAGTYMSHEFCNFACVASPTPLQFTGQLADL